MQTSPSSLAAVSSEIAALAKSAAPSVVSIEDHGRTSSGFYWRPDTIATASDLLQAKAGRKVSVTTASQAAVEGTVIGHDPSTALALIRVAASGPALPPAAGAAPALGEAVMAVGRNSYGAVCAVGFIALAGGPWRSMRGGELSQRVWIDMRLSRQLEGGALLDAGGHLLGMAVSGPRRRVVLIPAATIDRAGQELMTHGRIRRGYLGVSVQPVSVPAKARDGAQAPQPGAKERGLMILSLDTSGPAARAGLLQGDIMIAVGGQSPESPRALAHLLRALPIGQAVGIDVIRSGSPIKINVTIGESPAA